MKAVTITFTDENGKNTGTYITSSIKMGTVDQLFDIAERAEQFDDKELDDMSIKEVRELFNDIKAVIVRAFAYRFELNELDDGLELSELMPLFEKLMESIGGSFKKN